MYLKIWGSVILTTLNAYIFKENKFILCGTLYLLVNLWCGQVLVSYSSGQFSVSNQADAISEV